MDGFFNIYKEKGYTSFDVCNKIKHKFNEKKVGHTGTLDPNATGVMQVAIGKATKLLPLLEDHIKIYIPTVKFGILTDTLDPEGNIISKSDNPQINLSLLQEKLNELMKMTKQVPPMYSAIKVDGKKLYEYAREGKKVELEPRPIKIYEAKTYGDFFYEGENLCIKLYLKVSKGFYVRSFVRDLASKFNVVAIMSDLERIQTGNFIKSNSKSLDDLTENDLISIEEVFKDYDKFYAKEYLVKLIKNGIMLDERQIVTNKPFLVYFKNKLIAIYEPIKTNKYKIVQYLGD